MLICFVRSPPAHRTPTINQIDSDVVKPPCTSMQTRTEVELDVATTPNTMYPLSNPNDLDVANPSQNNALQRNIDLVQMLRSPPAHCTPKSNYKNSVLSKSPRQCTPTNKWIVAACISTEIKLCPYLFCISMLTSQTHPLDPREVSKVPIERLVLFQMSWICCL